MRPGLTSAGGKRQVSTAERPASQRSAGQEQRRKGPSNTSLTSIDLDKNQVSDEGASAIAAALGHNTTLLKLGLAHNRVGDVGMKALEEVMACANTSLLLLRTTGNPAHPALLQRLATAVTGNVKAPFNIRFRFACVYRYRQRIRRNRPELAGTPPFDWNISPSLPAGLAFNPETGEISGVPQVFWQSSLFTVTATNASGTSTTHVQVQVDSGVIVSSPSRLGAGQEQSDRFKVAFEFLDQERQGVLSRERALQALTTLRLRTDDFEELVYMLEIPVDGWGEPIIYAGDFVSIARAASTPTPELLTYPTRKRHARA